MTTLVIPDLAGKAVLVTGASTGIGAALALAYARQKCRVALHYNSSREAAEGVAKTIHDGGGEASGSAGNRDACRVRGAKQCEFSQSPPARIAESLRAFLSLKRSPGGWPRRCRTRSTSAISFRTAFSD